MDEDGFVVKTLWDDCLKAARVNILTGTYTFLKQPGTVTERACMNAATIHEYMAKTVAAGCIHPMDERLYLSLADKDFFAGMFTRMERKMSANFRGDLGDGYRWMTLEVLLPETFSPLNPEVLFCWRLADTAFCSMQEAMTMLACFFHKILRVNLSTDSYEVIKVHDAEMEAGQGMDPTLSGWFEGFARHGVMQEDRGEFRRFTDLENLRHIFRHECGVVTFRYRRNTERGFRWVSMELLPAQDFSNDNQSLMLYIRDIHDSYSAEMSYRKQLEYACTYDAMTGVKNRSSYDGMMERLSGSALTMGTGLLLAEVNGLRWRVESIGRSAADAFIQGFASVLTGEFDRDACYRVDNGVFAVLLQDLDERSFSGLAEHLRTTLRYTGWSMASLGYAWQPRQGSAEQLVRQAEQFLADEKNSFRMAHPDLMDDP